MKINKINKQLISQREPQSNTAMRPKEVRPKPIPYISPHIEIKTQRDTKIRALLKHVEATTEPQYTMSKSSEKAATTLQNAIRNKMQE